MSSPMYIPSGLTVDPTQAQLVAELFSVASNKIQAIRAGVRNASVAGPPEPPFNGYLYEIDAPDSDFGGLRGIIGMEYSRYDVSALQRSIARLDEMIGALIAAGYLSGTVDAPVISVPDGSTIDVQVGTGRRTAAAPPPSPSSGIPWLLIGALLVAYAVARGVR